MTDFADRVRGCLLGGAVGDALGAIVEFDWWGSIKTQYGERGVTAIEAPGQFTDDTQMTLFTVDGLIRASARQRAKGIVDTPIMLNEAYLRWADTQRVAPPPDVPIDGWLVAEAHLRQRKAPGHTCLGSLEAGGNGSAAQPINESKGCGGVMRAAPVGLVTNYSDDLAAVYDLGCASAALTHGHPDGYEPAGAFAVVVRALVDGASLESALDAADELTSAHMRDLLAKARKLGAAGPPDATTIEKQLGGGWVGDEALAIAVACSVGATFEDALIAAANHSGDSDSTAAIAGNILGAAHGAAVIPAQWLAALDGRAIVETVADDLVREVTDPPEDWGDRYPA